MAWRVGQDIGLGGTPILNRDLCDHGKQDAERAVVKYYDLASRLTAACTGPSAGDTPIRYMACGARWKHDS